MRKNNNIQVPQVQKKSFEVAQGTTSNVTPQEPGHYKHPTTHTGGARKKMKAHKMPPEYTITEDDADMVDQLSTIIQSRILRMFHTKGT
jgi:hypothetical protein